MVNNFLHGNFLYMYMNVCSVNTLEKYCPLASTIHANSPGLSRSPVVIGISDSS